MSAEISADVVDISSFADVHRIQVFRDVLVLLYPRHAKYLAGSRVHALAPLLALGEPVPAALGPIRQSVWKGASSISIRRAGDLPDPGVKRRNLDRALHHPAGTPFFLLDCSDFKDLVRLTEFCRIGFDHRDRACVVFNDIGYIVAPIRGAGAAFKADVVSRFPKSKAGSAAGEISGFSTWSDSGYAVASASKRQILTKIAGLRIQLGANPCP